MSEKFRMNCPHCGHPLRVRHEYVGKKGTCRECGKDFWIRVPEEDKGDTAHDMPAVLDGPTDELWGGPRPEPPPPKPELPDLPDEPPPAVDFGLSASVERLEKENAALRAELEELKAKYERRRAALADALGKAERNEKSAAKLKAELDATCIDRDHFAEGFAEAVQLRLELDEMKGTMAGNVAELGSKFHESKMGWEAEKESLLAEWTTRWEGERDAARGDRDETESLRSKLAEAEAQLESERAGLRTKLAEAEAQLESQRTAAELEKAGLRDELTQARAEVAHRDEDHADFREAAAASLRLKDEGHAAERDRWEACRAAWTAERESLAAASGANAEADRRIADLEEQLRAANENAEGLTQNDAQHTTARASMEDDLAALRARIAEMAREIQHGNEFRDQMVKFLGGMGISFPR